MRVPALRSLLWLGALLVSITLSCTESTTDNFSPQTPPDSCTPQTNIDGCNKSGEMGYACTGGRAPDDGDDELACTRGTPGSGALDGGTGGGAPVLYCCITYAQRYSLCAVDRTQPHCGSEAYGFFCTGAVGPGTADPSLSCSAPLSTGSAELYCCAFASVPATCQADDGVPGCADSEIGFACSGSDTPATIDASLTCDAKGIPAGGRTLYCCVSR